MCSQAREARRFQEAGRILEEMKSLHTKKIQKEVELSQNNIQLQEETLQLQSCEASLAQVLDAMSKQETTHSISIITARMSSPFFFFL